MSRGAAPKPVCPLFEFKSAGNDVARIACNYGSGHTWQEFKGQRGSRDHLEKRNEHYKTLCCGNPAGCHTYRILGPKGDKADEAKEGPAQI